MLNIEINNLTIINTCNCRLTTTSQGGQQFIFDQSYGYVFGSNLIILLRHDVHKTTS